MRHFIALVLLGISVSAASPTQIDDPEAFVKDVYKKFVASQPKGDYNPPEDIYTPRLKALFVRDQKWAKGEVGCIDFMFWVAGQDYRLKDVQVSSAPAGASPDRRTVIAKFSNLGTAKEIHFDFQRIGTRWLLDDARSLKSGDAWTLSKALNCPH